MGRTMVAPHLLHIRVYDREGKGAEVEGKTNMLGTVAVAYFDDRCEDPPFMNAKLVCAIRDSQ